MAYSNRVEKQICEEANNRYYKNERIFGELSKKFNRDASLIKFVYTHLHDNYRNSFDTYDTLSEILSSYGYNEEKIFEFIKNNRELLLVNKMSLLRKLIVLNSVNLSEEALFENPKYLVRNNNFKQIYGSIYSLQQEGLEITLDNVFANVDEESEYNEKLNNTHFKVLSYKYLKKISEKKLEIQENSDEIQR